MVSPFRYQTQNQIKMVKLKKIIFGLLVMMFAVVALSSCNKDNDDTPVVSEKPLGEQADGSVDAQAFDAAITPLSWYDGLRYETNSILGSHAQPLNQKRFVIPSKTAYCIKLTDSYRKRFRSYEIFVKFDPQISQARNAYFYFDRKRNYNAWDDDGDIPTKAIYNGYTGHTNSSGPQMEGGWLEPDFQWIRIKNPLEEPIHLVITARFKY